MRTTEPTALGIPPRIHPDRTLVRRLVIVNAIVPALIFGWDAYRHQLGANGVNYALHTTGLLALLFFIVSLVVTPLKRLTGWSELVAGRRALGLAGFFYLVVHFGIFVLWDRAGDLSSTVHEILVRRYLQLGTIALVLFIPIAATSTDGMISRLGPRRWKRIHRLTYIATSLGAIHYVLLVKSDVRQPLVFAGVLGVLLAQRGVSFFVDRRRRAKKRPWQGELAIVETRDETPDVRTFRLAPVARGNLPFTHRPGQYLNVALVVKGQRVNRSYTIASSSETRDHVEITVRNVPGVASSHLHEALRIGEKIKVTAPAGRFVFEGDGDSHVLLVAGGVGITPLMAMIRTLGDRRWRGKIDLVYSARTEADIIFAAELAELVKKMPTLRVTVTLSRVPEGDAWTGARGHISRELLERVAPDLRTVPIYLCGPDAMMDGMKKLFAEIGVPDDHVHLEAFVSPPSRGDASTAVEEEAMPTHTGPATVQFAISGENTSVEEGETLLDAAEAIGVDIPNDCRSGICGQCKIQLVKGRVVMDVQEALTSDDRKRRLVLACQARPVADVVIDA